MSSQLDSEDIGEKRLMPLIRIGIYLLLCFCKLENATHVGKLVNLNPKLFNFTHHIIVDLDHISIIVSWAFNRK